MVNAQQLRAFLREWYLHSRFEGRDGANGWPKDYSDCVVKSTMHMLESFGVGRISMFESRTGKPIEFDEDLNILNADVPSPQIQAKSGSLTKIYHGQHW